MHNQEKFNFLTSLSSEKISYFRKIVTECVLSTDLAKSMFWISSVKISLKGFVSEGRNHLKKGVSSLEESPEQLASKLMRMQLLIKCADVGHPSRPLHLHLEWSRRICEEFYSQGDLERNRGLKISPLCDRNVLHSNYPLGQIGN